PEQIVGNDSLTVRLQQPPGVAVALRNAALQPLASATNPTRAFPHVRSAYLLGDSNLAGHAFTMLALVAVVLAPSMVLSMVAFLAAVAAVLTTGSRTAWAVLIVAGLLLFWLRVDRRGRLILVLVAAAGAMVLVFLPDAGAVLGRLNLEGFTAANSV